MCNSYKKKKPSSVIQLNISDSISSFSSEDEIPLKRRRDLSTSEINSITIQPSRSVLFIPINRSNEQNSKKIPTESQLIKREYAERMENGSERNIVETIKIEIKREYINL